MYAIIKTVNEARSLQKTAERPPVLYLNMTITILDIIHHHVCYLKNGVSVTGFCLCLQVEPTEIGPTEIVTRNF
jgi:hypothetical protein